MTIELCVSSLEAISLASKFDFDRIELCQALEVGGLTPSLALQKTALESFPNTHVLIRARAGNFHYSEAEKELMLADIQACYEIGIPGVVVGSLTNENEVDLEFIQNIKKRFPSLELTFHRAFDDIKKPLEALEQLIELGVKRILTSGGKKSVSEGLEQLKSCISHANGKIEIMIGGGINSSNISTILKEIKPNAVHFSGTNLQKSQDNSLFSEDLLIVDEEKIAQILACI